ncbi:MAG: protein kinase [Cyanobacteria bacterium SZAS-4]|nr:protein kinase [Cyanobacteria bacterium SZAS-4]
MDERESGTTDDVTVRLSGASEKSTDIDFQAESLGILHSGDIFLGRYKILNRIGQGGMGVVYRCTQVFIGKEMAIKSLNKTSLNDEAIQRFQTEAKAAGTLNHPNIVAVHDFGVTENSVPYMVMDYAPGKTLQDALSEQGQLPLEKILDIFIECTDALGHAHENGVLHRDIKPSNIVLLQDQDFGPGSIRILDFGIAKISSESSHTQELTKTGVVIGSPLYMSPEQSIGRKMDQRTDIYSLGCVLHECLCGAPPFQGETVIETLMLHQTQAPQSLKEASLGRDLPERMQELLTSMMTKNFEERTASMRIVQHELIEIREQLSNPHKKKRAESATSKTDSQGKKNLLVPMIISSMVLVVTSISLFIFSLLNHQERSVSLTSNTDSLFLTPGEISASYDQRVRRAVLEARRGGADHCAINNVEFSPSQFNILENAKWIRDLTLIDCTGITADGLSQILANNLLGLNIVGSALDDQCLALISQSQSIRYLNISRCYGFSPKGLLSVARMKELVTFRLHRTIVNDDILRVFFENNQNWSGIDIGQNAFITDETLRLIGRRKKSYCLEVPGTLVSSKGLEHLDAACVNLNLFGDTGVDDKGLATLVRNCPELRILSIEGTSVTEKGVMLLTNLKKLEDLHLSTSIFADPDAKRRVEQAFKAKQVKLQYY